MCGIAGILNLHDTSSIPEDLLFRMVAILRHRGPDESGAYLDRRIGLGQARLSIVGLGDGTQPIANEDGSLWIVYNGEAFNYPEVKEELLRKGHLFTTGTDTEVVLHLYEELGPACLERINGQFALAIWDTRRSELFLARDRVGIRPLFYTLIGGRFLFASEIKALLLHPDVRREVDPEGLAQTFTYWTTLSPKTVFAGIREVPAGHYLRIRDSRITEQSWWQLPYYPPGEGFRGTQGEAREELAGLLTDAVRLRLRADVPVGAYLSGGLDSSILTSIIARRFDQRLRTFSIGFGERAFDESAYQQEMVRHLGTDHSARHIGTADIRRHLPEVVWHCEKPLLRTAPVPLFLLSRLVRQSGFKVVLTGEGADEVFAGYNIFKEAKIRRFWSRRPESRLRPLLLERLYPYVFQNAARERFFLQKFYALRPEDAADPFFSHRIRWENGRRNLTFLAAPLAAALAVAEPVPVPPGFADRDDLARAQLLEIEIFLANYLLSSQGDRVAMAHSIELRHPFLDYRVIDFAFRLPAGWKLPGLREKQILKDTFRDLLPPAVCNRPKQPYRAPIREVFTGGGDDSLIDHVLSESSLRRAGLFDPEKVGRLVRKFRESRSGHASEQQNMAITGIVTSQLLHYQFIEGHYLTAERPPRPDRIIRRSEPHRGDDGRRWRGEDPFRYT